MECIHAETHLDVQRLSDVAQELRRDTHSELQDERREGQRART